MPTVTLCEPAAVEEAADVLGRAFRDNAAYRTGIPIEPERRGPKVRRIKRAFLGACMRWGEARVVTDGGRVQAVSLVYPPGRWPTGVWPYLARGWGAALIGPAHTLRLSRVDAWMRRGRPSWPHYYLHVIGVDPPAQGRGFGGLLLRDLAARADAEGVPAYLETDEDRNVGLYERHGFRVTERGVVPGLPSLTMWRMVRGEVP